MAITFVARFTPTHTIAMTASGTSDEETPPIVAHDHMAELPIAASGARWRTSVHSLLAIENTDIMRSFLSSPILMVGLVAGANTTASADTVSIVTEPNLDKTWTLDSPSLDYLAIGGVVRFEYGCVNIGFFIEIDGSVTGPFRAISFRTNKKIAKWDETIRLVQASLSSATWTYTPAAGGDVTRATYTSASIPIFKRKFEETLDQKTRDVLRKVLHDACVVNDLADRLGNEEGPVQLDPLPERDELLREHAE